MAAALSRAGAVAGQPAPDAVIFTGAEPRAAELDQEPYWRELTDLFDAAQALTFATLASCPGRACAGACIATGCGAGPIARQMVGALSGFAGDAACADAGLARRRHRRIRAGTGSTKQNSWPATMSC